MVVLVTGSTGFLGRRVVRELLERGHEVRCLVHTPGRERIFAHREVEVQYGSIGDRTSLENAFYDVESVIHLVGGMRLSGSNSFDTVHREGTANVLAASKEVGARHFLHVSAIGAANAQAYRYLHTKWLGEQEVKNSGIHFTIFRPSILFGEGDQFLNVLAAMVRLSPFVPVIGSGKNRLQPLAADDLARCIAISLSREDLKGKTIDLGGTERLNYSELVIEVARAMGKRRMRFHVPVRLMRLVAAVCQGILPRTPVTTEQIKMLGIRNVAELGEVERVFGFTPKSMKGNIDYVNSLTFGDGVQMVLGGRPKIISNP